MPTLSLLELEQTAVERFRDIFGSPPTLLALAPGRVELLGNHTDYNGGHVLAAAIDRFTVVAVRPVPGPTARVRSIDFGGEVGLDLDAIPEPVEVGSWGRYVCGVVWALQEARGPLPGGFEAVIAGNIPVGAGLSSSASLQAALALGLLGPGVVESDDARMILARQLQRSENAYVGVASGLLDQFSVLFGREGHALSLDCQTLAYARLPLGSPAPSIVICDSKTSRKLADGMYNLRREECERIIKFFKIDLLCNLTMEDLESNWSSLDPVGRLRARHVLTEDRRVVRGAELLRIGQLAEFGEAMTTSHRSSRDDFANSSPRLDALIEAATTAPGFLGGKLSGAGWAGCTVNLVEAEQAESFGEAVTRAYEQVTGVVPAIHICHPAEGASVRVCC